MIYDLFLFELLIFGEYMNTIICGKFLKRTTMNIEGFRIPNVFAILEFSRVWSYEIRERTPKI